MLVLLLALLFLLRSFHLGQRRGAFILAAARAGLSTLTTACRLTVALWTMRHICHHTSQARSTFTTVGLAETLSALHSLLPLVTSPIPSRFATHCPSVTSLTGLYRLRLLLYLKLSLMPLWLSRWSSIVGRVIESCSLSFALVCPLFAPPLVFLHRRVAKPTPVLSRWLKVSALSISNPYASISRR
jgi:hypothetical protein